MNNANVKAGAAPAATSGGDVDFSEVAEKYFPGYPADVAERVKAHLAAAALFGRLSLGHAIAAGWLLYSQRIHTPWGEWGNWCRDALGISHQTANNYIGLFAATVGAARKVDGIPFENYITKREMEFATVGMEDKSVTRAMIDLGVVKRKDNWGGDQREKAAKNGKTVGRPPKGAAEEVAKELDAAANYEPAMWASAQGAIRTVAELDGKRLLFSRLTDEHLAIASRLLGDLARKAGEALEARLARRDAGLSGEEMETSEAANVRKGGL